MSGRSLRPAAIIAALAACVVILGCAGVTESPEPGDDVFSGEGTGNTFEQAVGAATVDAVRAAVLDLVGAATEQSSAELLRDYLYAPEYSDRFVHAATLKMLRPYRGTAYIEIRVDLPAVRLALEQAGVHTAPSPEAGRPAIDDAGWGAVTPEEERFIRRYVETMTYMVHFDDREMERLGTLDFAIRSAVTQANAYLVADGRVVVDAAQVERLKADEQLRFEEQTGRAMSVTQWLAQRLSADVYITLDVRHSIPDSGDSQSGSAEVTLNMYETSTAQVLGSVNRGSRIETAAADDHDAVVGAVQSAVNRAMPVAVQMARQQMANVFTRGIRYEVAVRNPPDPRILSRFRAAVSEHVRGISTIRHSQEEAVYEVFVIGNSDDVVELVYTVAEGYAGLEDLALVLSRGRSIVFDAGF
jgi:hypothetical protein